MNDKKAPTMPLTEQAMQFLEEHIPERAEGAFKQGMTQERLTRRTRLV